MCTKSGKRPSLFSPDKLVLDHQYIAEVLCKNKAGRAKSVLPAKFWQLPKWESYYKSQLRRVSHFLKLYGFDCVIGFISSKQIYSLWPKWIDEAMAKYNQEFIEKRANIQVDEINIVKDSIPSNNVKNWNFLDG